MAVGRGGYKRHHQILQLLLLGAKQESLHSSVQGGCQAVKHHQGQQPRDLNPEGQKARPTAVTCSGSQLPVALQPAEPRCWEAEVTGTAGGRTPPPSRTSKLRNSSYTLAEMFCAACGTMGSLSLALVWC